MAENRGIAPPDVCSQEGEARTGFIYGLMCKCHPEDGIRYIGQTSKTVGERVYTHKRDAKTRGGKNWGNAVYHWMRKHGYENIEAVTLEEEVSVFELNSLEEVWVSRLKTLKDFGGLNLTTGGGQGYGVSESTREKLRLAWTPERKKAQRDRVKKSGSLVKRGPMPEETKKKISEAKKGVKPREDWMLKAVETRIKNGSLSGERNGRSNISDSTARDIYLASWAQYETMDDIAARYGVTNHTVQRIKYRMNWRSATQTLAKDLFDE